MKTHNEEQPLMVSIKCMVYNHEPYIRQCLEGFVMQKTDFRFEAIVHDDASTDGSAAIIREYAEKYPNIIKPILETENQWSKHDGSLARIMDAACQGKYIAFCEGDDYWTDPTKLQRQVSFLERHPDYVATAENGIIHFLSSHEERLFSNEKERDVTFGELAEKRRFPTASVVCRRDALAGMEDYKTRHDTMTWLHLVSRGKFRYMENVSSVYNRGSGVTETTPPYEWAEIVERWNKEIKRVFGGKYDMGFVKKNIYDEYYKSMCKYLNRGYHGKKMLKCWWKCFRIHPYQMTKFSIKRLAHLK